MILRTLLTAALLLLAIPVAAAPFSMCGAGTRYNCVVDGDTLWLKRTKIRLERIDAPEVSHPACAAEAARGALAGRRLLALLNAGGWTAEEHGRDIYGRRLATFAVGHTDLGAILMSEGLAQPWPNVGNVWCGY